MMSSYSEYISGSTVLGSILSITLLAFAAFYATAQSHGLRLTEWMKKQIHAGRPRSQSKPSLSRQATYTINPPCEQIIKQAREINQKNGHENLGFLSLEAGFSPLEGPVTSLPEYYHEWDRLAEKLPHLVKTQTIRRAIGNLPQLDATKDHLPDSYLHRAATILGLAAHVYVRLEGDLPLETKFKSHAEILPPSIYVPWTQVCDRLGRPHAILTYTDLVLYNFKTSARSLSQMHLENSELLIPTVDNKEEQMFYGVMIEMNARAIPVIQNVVEAHRSVLAGDPARLKQNIRQLTTQIRRLTKITLSKLTVNPSKRTCIDPVIWTETVANLAVPWLAGTNGSAATAHPFFHMMDEFTNRNHYDTKLGEEALQVRALFPQHWRQFFSAIQEVSVDNYVAATNDSELTTLWDTLRKVYLGDEGLIGYHRRKVYGFLSVSFRIGRNSKVSGLGQKRDRAEWQEAHQEFEESELKRSEFDEPQLVPADVIDKKQRRYPVHEIIQHNSKDKGFWFVAQGKVYDATPYLAGHPGGESIIKILSGKDATKDLNAVAHFSNPRIKKLLDQYQVGRIQYQRFSSASVDNVYTEFVNFAYKLTEIESTYRAMTSFLDKPLTSADLPHELNAHRARHLLLAKEQLRETYTPALAESLEHVINMLTAAGGLCGESTRQLLYELKSRADSKPLIHLDLNNLPSWDAAFASVQRNLHIMAQVKTSCTDILEELSHVDKDLEMIHEDVLHTFMSTTTLMISKVNQLGCLLFV